MSRRPDRSTRAPSGRRNPTGSASVAGIGARSPPGSAPAPHRNRAAEAASTPAGPERVSLRNDERLQALRAALPYVSTHLGADTVARLREAPFVSSRALAEVLRLRAQLVQVIAAAARVERYAHDGVDDEVRHVAVAASKKTAEQIFRKLGFAECVAEAVAGRASPSPRSPSRSGRTSAAARAVSRRAANLATGDRARHGPPRPELDARTRDRTVGGYGGGGGGEQPGREPRSRLASLLAGDSAARLQRGDDGNGCRATDAHGAIGAVEDGQSEEGYDDWSDGEFTGGDEDDEDEDDEGEDDDDEEEDKNDEGDDGDVQEERASESSEPCSDAGGSRGTEDEYDDCAGYVELDQPEEASGEEEGDASCAEAKDGATVDRKDDPPAGKPPGDGAAR